MTNRDRTFHLTAIEDGKTLGEVVRRRTSVSWGQAEQMILGRQVSVHGNLCLDAARRVKRGDVVKVLAQPMARPASADDLVLPYIDRHLVVVEKPAGVTSVRHVADRKTSKKRRQLQPTLDELLAERLARKGRPIPSKGPRHNRFAKRRGKIEPDRPADVFPVHRLDRDTSGLMVYAKSREAERALVAAFKRHDIERAYRAVVWGHPKQQTIESNLARDRGDGRRGSVLPGHTAGDAQYAVTHVRPIKALGDYHLVECRLETGRTHQIRIHLSELGHPLCGDRQYRHADQMADKSAAPRQALHAFKLKFAHPITGETMSFNSGWPADLARWQKDLQREVGA